MEVVLDVPVCISPSYFERIVPFILNIAYNYSSDENTVCYVANLKNGAMITCMHSPNGNNCYHKYGDKLKYKIKVSSDYYELVSNLYAKWKDTYKETILKKTTAKQSSYITPSIT